jgi:dienelactone hydrolase
MCATLACMHAQTLTRRFGRLALAWVLVITSTAAPAVAAVPTAEDFAAPAQIDNVVVSPSGRRMAVLITGAKGRVRLGVIDLDPIGQPRVVAGFDDANVRSVSWLNDERLLFEAYQDGAVIQAWGGGTFAVDHDGSDQLQLIAWARTTERTGSGIGSRVLPYGWFVHSTVDDGSDDVFVYRRVLDSRDEVRELELARLNTRSRLNRSLARGMPDGTRTWLLDTDSEPRIVVARREGRHHVYWRESKDRDWSEIAQYDPLKESGFAPLWIEADGSVVVSTSSGDTRALHRLDPRTKQIDPQPMVRVAGFDVDAVLETDAKTRRLLGVHMTVDRPMSVWFDARMDAVQRGVDAALPKDRINRLYCGRCESSRFFVVLSSSDRHPGEFFLFDRTERTLQKLGLALPRIAEATQGRRSYHRMPTRDGLSMPVYVTHPPGADAKQALPAVVLVHGGPWVRGASLRWHADAQFLATRGYRVIEPEFRGSTGYGATHYRAGWRQWGAAMQDDLVDALHWAAKEGLVDAGRVCVVGASYGGYAALMAPILHPRAFRCAASFAGVTDIMAMYDIAWSDITEDSRRYGMPALIGDPRKDEAMLSASSPLKRVAELKIPLLVTHGGQDQRVPVEHSRRFVRAAKEAGVKVQSHEYPEEGHGFFDPANRADHYRRLETFLEEQIGAGAKEGKP